jgi:16S rRNA (guanine966-N2)-methyltransferase
MTNDRQVRIIGGTHRGRRLSAPEGLMVRPTSDRLRETLFNILATRAAGSRFLDICAGSGAVGIEALSRGASNVTFIERARRACSVIESNLESLGLSREATIINRDAMAALNQLATDSRQFDIIFFDPPYASDLHRQVMKQLSTNDLLTDDSIVIVEHRAKTPPEPVYGGLKMYRVVKQGESALAFYEVVR